MLSTETTMKVIGLLQEGIEDLVCISEGDFDKDFTERDRDEAIGHNRSVMNALANGLRMDLGDLKFIGGIVKDQIEILADQSGPDFDEDYTEDDRNAEWKECQDAYDDIERERIGLNKRMEEKKATRAQLIEKIKGFYKAAADLSELWGEVDQNTFFDMCEEYPFNTDFNEIVAKIGTWLETQETIKYAREDGSYDLEQ